MSLRPFPLYFSILVGACALAVTASAADQTITGSLFVDSLVDVNGNTASFGTNGTSPGYSLIYTNGTLATVDFSATAGTVNWTWYQGTNKPQLKLDSTNTLNLYIPNATTPAIVLNPAGTSTFAQGLTVTGTFTTNSGITAGGSVVGGSAGLTLKAGGTNKNVTLTPSGTGLVTTAAPITFTNTTASTSSTTGALTVAGGVGVAGKLNVASDVAIGTATSTSRLTVAGAGTTSATSVANFTDSANKSLLFVRNDGNVGVGTTSPSEKLDVIGNIKLSGSLVIPGLNTDPFTMQNLAEGNHAEVRLVVGDNALDAESDRLSIGATDWGTTGWYPRFTVMSTGNVGIGTSAPAAKLDVVGDAKVSGATTLQGTVTVKTALRIPPSGDLDMGSFTAGTNPSL